ncbi:MAG: NifB/NifX family molybdenum-iron cluster-binding protein [Desulfuromonas sp.]|jgi:predicted Fe-Mo cluster-binding NifX family protein|nr:NifB/NifX family molybdenum-iron cluster-binding protein [Desulfuromonas thiophila]MDD3800945.1 NifB/NifX family molybdenum-iron cluster-binding protein [Desulfuromonas thiophila]MDY0397047.1 NifB/NifX family molybdenum-iron cluster-binding protein [Desulfuromonas thiophila]
MEPLLQPMCIAITTWNGRVAPVFDVAGSAELCQHSPAGLKRQVLPLPAGNGLEKLALLRRQGVRLLICGAISRPLYQAACAQGIEVIPFVAGALEDILHDWQQGCLQQRARTMPGCRRGRCCQRRGRTLISPAVGPEMPEP